jgi:hypothetical protein
MKLKTTRKEIEQNSHRIVAIGYCAAQNLLKYRSAFAYSCGVYGWNADYYEVDGVVIATGYRSLPNSKNTKCDYKTVRAFDRKAEKAGNVEKVNAILKKFIQEVTTK